MATLVSLQRNSGGRIPMGRFSYDVSRRDLIRIIESMPAETCRQMHIAARQGDTATAQRIIREAAATYYANAPAAPMASPVAPRISRTTPPFAGSHAHNSPPHTHSSTCNQIFKPIFAAGVLQP